MGDPKNVKKVAGGILIAVVVLVIGIVIFRNYQGSKAENNQEGLSDVTYLNQNENFKLYVYGENVQFHDGLKYQKLDTLDLKSIKEDKHDFVYLVINDLNGGADISYADLDKLIQYADTNTNFNFYYLGEKLISKIKANLEDCNLDSDDLSFGYVMYEGTRLQSSGVWTKYYTQYLKENKYIIGENLCDSMAMQIKSNKKSTS